MSTNADIVLLMKDTDAEVDNFIFQSCDKRTISIYNK